MRFFKTIIAVALALYMGSILVPIYKHCNILQWDFKTHYYAAEVDEAGLNFYDRPYLHHFARSPVTQYYSYPPLSIWFFRFFSLFKYRTAYTLFLCLKCIILLSLIILWQKEFLQAKGGVFFYVFLVFAFNGALYIDLAAGNISLFEQFGLWFAFFFFLRQRYMTFCLLVLLVSIFKVVPIFFLIVLLLSHEKKKYVYFLGSVAVFLFVHFISYLMNPFLFGEFVRIFSDMLREKRGITNPSTYVFLNSVFNRLNQRTGLNLPPVILPAVFLLVAIGIIFISWKAYLRLKQMPVTDRGRLMIFLTCLVYALLIPRFKDYSYTLLLVPAYFVLMNLTEKKGAVFFFILMILTIPGHANPPGIEVLSEFFWNFYPLVLAYLVWILLMQGIYDSTEKPIPECQKSIFLEK